MWKHLYRRGELQLDTLSAYMAAATEGFTVPESQAASEPNSPPTRNSVDSDGSETSGAVGGAVAEESESLAAGEVDERADEEVDEHANEKVEEHADEAAEQPVEWTSLDKDLLDAAVNNPARIPWLVNRGANVAVRSSSGQPLLVILIKNGLRKDETATVLKVLPGLLRRMTKEQINARNRKQMTALVSAVYGDPPQVHLAHRYEIIELLIKHHADLNAKDKDGCTALDWACRRGYTGIVRLLLDSGADADVKDNELWTPLETAARYGHDEILKMLLDKGVKVDEPDINGRPPLMVASCYGQDKIVKLLLEEDVEIDRTDESGLTALEEAVYGCYENIVQMLLDRGADPNKLDGDGCTLLYAASRVGYDGIVRLLLSRDCDVDEADEDGWTPLMAACLNNHKQVVIRLLERDPDIDKADSNGWTSLGIAARHGYTEIVDLLLDRGAEPNITNGEGWTPLGVASRYGFDDIVRALLRKGARPNISDAGAWNPLISASRWGYEAIVGMLLDAKADIHTTDESGLSALHSAAFFGHKEIVKLLLQRGADTTLHDRDGETPLHLASRQGYAVIVEELLKHQRRDGVNTRDKDSETALHVAARYTSERVSLLINDDAKEDTDRFCETRTGDDAPGRFQRVVELLLDNGADPTLLTEDGETALHSSARIDDGERTKLILNRTKEDRRALRNNDGETALYIAADRENPDTLRQLLFGLKAIDWGTDDIEEDTLLWAARSESTHDIVRLLLLYSKRPTTAQFPLDTNWDALTMAAYYGEYELVRTLLQSTGLHPGDNKRRKTAEAVVKKLIKLMESNDAGQDKRISGDRSTLLRPKDPDAGGSVTEKDDSESVKRGSMEVGRDGSDAKKSDDEGGEDAGSNTKSEARPSRPRVNVARSRECYDEILDILLDPPMVRMIVKTSAERVPYCKPELEVEFPEIDACIIDFYAKDGRSGFLRRFRDVEEVIYNAGPNEIMEQARNAMQNGDEDEDDDEAYSEEDLSFRWIHLPANNLQWMNDLVLRIFIDDDEPQEAHEELQAFLRASWHEVPDASFESRFMKPSCSTWLGDKWKDKPQKPPRGEPSEDELPESRRRTGSAASIHTTGSRASGSKAGSVEHPVDTKSDSSSHLEKPEQNSPENRCHVALYVSGRC